MLSCSDDVGSEAKGTFFKDAAQLEVWARFDGLGGGEVEVAAVLVSL